MVKAPRDLSEVIERLNATSHLDIVQRMRKIGLDPQVDFSGRDWRECSFRGAALEGFDFRNTRLRDADFTGAAIAGADFRGADSVHTANLHCASGFERAKLDEDQRQRIAAVVDAEAVEHRRAQMNRGMIIGEILGSLKRCKTHRQARLILDRMLRLELGPNGFAYAMAIELGTYSEARADYEEFIELGGRPDIPLLTNLLHQADPEGADAILEEVNKYNLKPDRYFFNRYISRRQDLDIGFDAADHMVAIGERVNEYTTYALFDCCRLFKDAISVIIKSHNSGINVFTIEMIRELESRTPLPDKTRDFVAEAIQSETPARLIVEGIVRRGFAGKYRRWKYEALRELGFR